MTPALVSIAPRSVGVEFVHARTLMDFLQLAAFHSCKYRWLRAPATKPSLYLLSFSVTAAAVSRVSRRRREVGRI